MVQAADDYRSACIRLHRHPHDDTARLMKRDAEEFFHSERFELFSDADPEYIFARLKSEVAVALAEEDYRAAVEMYKNAFKLLEQVEAHVRSEQFSSLAPNVNPEDFLSEMTAKYPLRP